MTPTIYDLTAALSHPEASFATLGEARLCRNADGTPRLHRTTDFAEALITWQGRSWLMAMPLDDGALHDIERTAVKLRHLDNRHIAPFRLLREELRCTDDAGRTRKADLLLHALPAGEPLDRAQRSPERLHEALDILRHELRRTGASHRNLKPENILVAPDGTMCVIRNYRMRFDGGEGDTDAFEALHRYIDTLALRKEEAEETPEGGMPAAETLYPGHIEVGRLSDGLVRVRDEAGYGYVDPQNRPVIPARYASANDFREGRAEAGLLLDDGCGGRKLRMGIIDKQGQWIVEPRFTHIQYDEVSNRILAAYGRHWSAFDYMGRETPLTADTALDEERAAVGTRPAKR